MSKGVALPVPSATMAARRKSRIEAEAMRKLAHARRKARKKVIRGAVRAKRRAGLFPQSLVGA